MFNKLEISFKNRVKNIHGEHKTWWRKSSFDDRGGWQSVKALRKDRMSFYKRSNKYNVRAINGGFALYRKIRSASENDFEIVRLV